MVMGMSAQMKSGSSYDLTVNEFLGGSPYAPVRLGDAVIERLTAAIHDGRLNTGDALPSEARIAASFSVRQTIACEAIRQFTAIPALNIQSETPPRIQELHAEPVNGLFRFEVSARQNDLNEDVELRRILERLGFHCLRLKKRVGLKTSSRRTRRLLFLG
jgi:GntR family transcriptional repressor for pyruvate dehydrogenase complex